MIPSLETRKKHTKYLTERTSAALEYVTDVNAIKGYILFVAHWITVGIPLLVLLIGDIGILFYISMFIWLCVFCMHFYFKGCICTRIERKLFDNDQWWGPWIFPFTVIMRTGTEMTSNLANNIFTCSGIGLATIVFLRMLYGMKDES